MARPRTAAASSPSPDSWADDLAGWKRKSLIYATGYSGAKFTIRPLTLDELAAEDALPDDLLHVAMLEWARDETGGIVGDIARKLKKGDAASLEAVRKLSRDNVALRKRIVVEALVKPKVTEKDLAALDPYDVDMIAALSQRQISRDATGKRVGADTLDTFREAAALLARAETDPARKELLLELAEVQ